MPQRNGNNNEKLFKSLKALCEIAINKTLQYQQQGELIKIEYQYLPVKTIDYMMETYQPDWEKLEYFDFYEWNSQEFVSFLDNELYTLPEFENAAKEIMSEYQAPELNTKKIGLFSLLRLIMKKAPNGQFTYDDIDYYVSLFIEGYESHRNNKPINWQVKLWLSNIYIESDEIEIAPNVFLRRPTKDQLADISQRPNHITEFERMTGGSLIAGAILSFSVAAGNRPVIGFYPKKITMQIERWLNVFRLLKPTEVTIVQQDITPISIFEHAHSENKESPHDKFWQGKVDYRDTDSYKLYLKKDEEELFKRFIRSLKSRFKGLSQKSYLSGSPYEIGFHRYNDSLLRTEVKAYRIVASISSFESLLKGDFRETAYQVKPRIIKLLSLFGFNATRTFQKLTNAYLLRNALAHGEKPKKGSMNLLKFARNHTHEILNFNRICLLVALQLRGNIDKSKLIKLIDSSLKDKIAHDKLKKLIGENVSIPIIDPFPKRVRRKSKP